MSIGLIGRWHRLVCRYLGHDPAPLIPELAREWAQPYYCRRCGKFPLPTGYDLI